MTETEWLASEDPQAMLRWLWAQNHGGPNPSPRKMRLFASAVFLTDIGRMNEDDLRALATAEDHADGLITDAELREAHERFPVDRIAEFLLRPDADVSAVSLMLHYFPGAHADARGEADSPERVADLLREIVGNPFRPVDMRGRLPGGKGSGIVYNPWLVNDTVQSLATAAYEARTPQGHLDPARLAVLADALEEAGCQEETLLQHLRGREPCTDSAHTRGGGAYWCAGCGGTEEGTEGWMPLRGPRVRGCWSLDLVLGKG